ncbi:MAG: hypothetical protein ABEJ05_05035 [Haloglomus sp.]
MGDRRHWKRFLRSKLRSAGRQVEAARREYETARKRALADLSTDEDGRAKIVCRRYAERRAVDLDEEARPVCYDPDHVDCQGCVEDIREGRIETW